MRKQSKYKLINLTILVFTSMVSLYSQGIISPKIQGFNFPESELTLNKWIRQGNEAELAKHSWGIWAGITSEIKMGNEKLPFFESWKTPSEIIKEIQGEKGRFDQNPLTLKGINRVKSLKAKKSVKPVHEKLDTQIIVTVAYNKPAAEHALKNKLFLESSLKAFLREGYTEIPSFPVDAITIKPVYKWIPQGVKDYSFPVWTSGDHSIAVNRNNMSSANYGKGYDESQWKYKVFVTTDGKGAGAGKVASVTDKQTDDTTYNLSDFVTRKVVAADIPMIKNFYSNANPQVGDHLILVGMHVTSREIKRWSWQTFWWSANPAVKSFPTTDNIIAAKPGVLTNQPAGHYAMSIAYQMLQPAQPVFGGQNVGNSLYAYNPYLEAGFNNQTFHLSKAVLNKKTSKYEFNNVGAQTNCMSCHRVAIYTPGVDYSNSDNTEIPYTADAYYAEDDSVFNGSLKLDFAWSILGNIVLDKKK